MAAQNVEYVEHIRVRFTCADCGAVVTRTGADESFVRSCGHIGAGITANVSADLRGRGGATREG